MLKSVQACLCTQLFSGILLMIAPQAAAADWVCGAISANGQTGFSIKSTKKAAQAGALSSCGSGCFITGCEYGPGQTEAEANRTPPSAPTKTYKAPKPTKPQRVFNNIPEARIPKPRPSSPVATPEAQQAKTKEPPSAPVKSVTTTSPSNLHGCRYPDQVLPTAKDIKVNPCDDPANNKVYNPQPRTLHTEQKKPIFLGN